MARDVGDGKQHIAEFFAHMRRIVFDFVSARSLIAARSSFISSCSLSKMSSMRCQSKPTRAAFVDN
jgi:hypothetical protein